MLTQFSAVALRAQRDAFGADRSKPNGLLAYNAKGGDGRHHIYTVKPDGVDPAQFGVGATNFPQRTTGSPVWSLSGRLIAFVAEKSDHPGNSVVATPRWGGYLDLWVANADSSHAWQLTDVPADQDHSTIIPELSPDGRLLEWSERTKMPRALNPNRFAGYWLIKVANFNVGPDGTPSLSDIRTVSPAGDAFNETGGFSADSADVADVVNTFVQRLTNEPTRCAILARQPSGDAVPVPLCGSGDFLAETRDGGSQLTQGDLEIAIVVTESAGSQVVEHRLQDRPILGANAVQADGGGDVDIAEMTKVLGDRPDSLTRSDPKRVNRDRGDHLPDRAGQTNDDVKRLFDRYI